MKDEAKEIRTMRKSALSHAKALRWILRRLENLNAQPSIELIRVRANKADETGGITFVTSIGIIRDPEDWRTLGGLAPRNEEEEEASPTPSASVADAALKGTPGAESMPDVSGDGK